MIQVRALLRPEGFSVVVLWIGWIVDDLLDVLNVMRQVVEVVVLGLGEKSRHFALVVCWVVRGLAVSAVVLARGFRTD